MRYCNGREIPGIIRSEVVTPTELRRVQRAANAVRITDKVAFPKIIYTGTRSNFWFGVSARNRAPFAAPVTILQMYKRNEPGRRRSADPVPGLPSRGSQGDQPQMRGTSGFVPVGSQRKAADGEQGPANKSREAVAAWKAHCHSRAIRLFHEAADEDPSNPVLLINLARAYGMDFQYQKSAQLTQQIAEKFGDDAGVNLMLAESDYRYNFLDAAEAHLLRAIGIGLDTTREVRAWAMLARIRERLHRLEEAMTAVESALAKMPGHPMALMQQAKILLRQDTTNQAIEICESLVARPDLAPNVRSEAWYAISKQQEKGGRYDDAWRSAQKAKAAYDGTTQTAQRRSEFSRLRNRRILEMVDQATIQRWRGKRTTRSAGNERTRPGATRTCWMIGHPRSGTTLLGQILSGHSDMAMADELSVFATSTYPLLQRLANVGLEGSEFDVLDHASPEDIQTCRQQFFSQIEGAIQQPLGDRMLLNKNPDLTPLLPGICRIFPDAKIIVAIRDPRDVVVSSFLQFLPLNPTSHGFFSIESTASRYAQSMNVILKLREAFNEALIQVRYEDVVADTESEARKTLDFLGLDWQPDVLKFDSRSRASKVNSPTYCAVTKPIYNTSVGRWQHYRAQLEPIYDLLVPYCRGFGYEA